MYIQIPTLNQPVVNREIIRLHMSGRAAW